MAKKVKEKIQPTKNYDSLKKEEMSAIKTEMLNTWGDESLRYASKKHKWETTRDFKTYQQIRDDQRLGFSKNDTVYGWRVLESMGCSMQLLAANVNQDPITNELSASYVAIEFCDKLKQGKDGKMFPDNTGNRALVQLSNDNAVIGIPTAEEKHLGMNQYGPLVNAKKAQNMEYVYSAHEFEKGMAEDKIRSALEEQNPVFGELWDIMLGARTKEAALAKNEEKNPEYEKLSKVMVETTKQSDVSKGIGFLQRVFGKDKVKTNDNVK